MITPAERVLVEALRRSSSISIRFGDCEVKVRNSEFSHDVAIALQSHLNRVHDASARDGRGLDGNRKKRNNR